jgi:hypothetical protein
MEKEIALNQQTKKLEKAPHENDEKYLDRL